MTDETAKPEGTRGEGVDKLIEHLATHLGSVVLDGQGWS